MEQAFIKQIIKNYDGKYLGCFEKTKWINCPPPLSKKDGYMIGYLP